MRKLLLFMGCAAWIVSAGLFFPSCAALQEGKSPVLVTSTLNNAIFNMADMKGKVVIIHFWATWCTSCREEMPVLDNFYVKYHSKGVEMLAVGLNNKHERDDAVAYMKDFHFPASLAIDATENGFGSQGSLPVTYVLDKTGTVRGVLTPEQSKLTPQSLESAVLPLLTP